MKKAEIIFSQQMGLTIYQLQRLDKIKPDQMIAQIEHWEDLSDMELLSSINLKQFLAHSLYLITDISYIHKVIFQTSCNHLLNFMKQYFHTYKECFLVEILFLFLKQPILFFIFIMKDIGFYIRSIQSRRSWNWINKLYLPCLKRA